MTASKLQRLLLWAAWTVAAVLLGRFSIDFVKEMPALLAAPFVLLVGVALAVAAINGLAVTRSSPPLRERASTSRVVTALLLLSVPLGFLASSLDCTGLSAEGCTPFCTFIKVIWIPVMAVACVVYWRWRAPLLLSLILLMSFVPLAPHCSCFNVGNGWWIERVGASPTCYAWGFTTSLLALGALRAARREWLSLLVNAAIIGGATAFFVSHHYFHFPW
ncbi:MAG: hypothetical protein ACJ74J_06125 [Blastocatellia bacterium]